MLSLSAAALNHLLLNSGWAMQRLARFHGKTAQFTIAPFSFAYTVLPDGSVTSAASGSTIDAKCNILPTLLPRLALQDEAAYTQIETRGDTAFLAEIFYISKHLRWDAAEDISQLTGDIAAERLLQLAGSAQHTLRDGALNLAQAIAEYWTEERPLVAKSADVQHFIRQVDTLRDDLARLEQRINRLTQ